MWKTVINKSARVIIVLTKVISHSFRNGDNVGERWTLEKKWTPPAMWSMTEWFWFLHADHYYRMVFSLHENVENLYSLIKLLSYFFFLLLVFWQSLILVHFCLLLWSFLPVLIGLMRSQAASSRGCDLVSSTRIRWLRQSSLWGWGRKSAEEE